MFADQQGEAPAEIVLNVEATDDRLHGETGGRGCGVRGDADRRRPLGQVGARFFLSGSGLRRADWRAGERGERNSPSDHLPPSPPSHLPPSSPVSYRSSAFLCADPSDAECPAAAEIIRSTRAETMWHSTPRPAGRPAMRRTVAPGAQEAECGTAPAEPGLGHGRATVTAPGNLQNHARMAQEPQVAN